MFQEEDRSISNARKKALSNVNILRRSCLPLNFFESGFTRSLLLRIESCSNRMDLRGEIRLIADEVRQEMKVEFQGTFMTIVCDGWKNSLTGMLNMFTLNIL